MWVKFTSNYDWKVPGLRAWRNFKEGQKVNVPQQCADDAIAAGKAEAAENRSKSSKKAEKAASEPENGPDGDSDTVYLTDTPETDDDGADTAA